MIIPFTLLFNALGFPYYKSKDEVSIIKDDVLDTQRDQIEDDLYKHLEDLFI